MSSTLSACPFGFTLRQTSQRAFLGAHARRDADHLPIRVDDETLAYDLIREVGPGGEFVTHAHTLAHFRDAWYPRLLYRGGDKAWQAAEVQEFEARVRARTRELIGAHVPEPLLGEAAGAITGILLRAEEQVDR